jgi:hypothetical protein
MELTDDPKSELVRWARATCLLSLDEVLPHYDLMGLHPGNNQGLLQVIRRQIVGSRVYPDATGGALGRARVLGAVEAAFGRQARDHLDWWVKYLLHLGPQDNVALGRWMWLFRRCRPPNPLWEQVGLPSALREEAADRLLRAISTDEYQRRRAVLASKPLSDWDLHLYASVPFADDEPGPSTPQVYITLTILDYQGYIFWAWLLKNLQPDQLDVLWESGKQVVREQGLKSIGELPPPHHLDIGL